MDEDLRRYALSRASERGATSYETKYDREFHKRLSQRMERRVIQRAFDLAPGPYVRALDVPCGAGRLTPELAPYVQGTIFEADYSPTMLHHARASAERRGELPARRYTRVDALSLPFADRSFDLVFSARLSHHIANESDRERWFREVCRVSSKTVIATVFDHWSFKNLLRLARSSFSGKRPKNTIKIARVHELAEQHGFELRAAIPLSRIFSGHRYLVLSPEVPVSEELVVGEDVIGVLDSIFERTPAEELAKLGDEETRDKLRADIRTLGLVGTIAALAMPGAPDPEVLDEAGSTVKRELSTSLGSPVTSIPAGIEAYASKKAARGRDLARRLVARAVFDLYDLGAHGLSQEDLLRAGDVLARARTGRDARVLAVRIARLSNHASQVVLGHVPDNIALVHRLRSEAHLVLPSEIDAALMEYAPRVLAVRLPSIFKVLLPKEPKARLPLVMWGRFRGLTLQRERLSTALDTLVPEKPMTMLHALLKPEARAELAALAVAERGPAGAAARELEDALVEL